MDLGGRRQRGLASLVYSDAHPVITMYSILTTVAYRAQDARGVLHHRFRPRDVRVDFTRYAGFVMQMKYFVIRAGVAN